MLDATRSLSMRFESLGIEDNCVFAENPDPRCAQMVEPGAEPDRAEANEHFQSENRKDEHVCFSSDRIVMIDGWMQMFDAGGAHPSSNLVQLPIPGEGNGEDLPAARSQSSHDLAVGEVRIRDVLENIRGEHQIESCV